MDGIQKTVHNGLKHLATKVAEGRYGEGDDAFQHVLDEAAFLEDLQDEVIGQME